MQSEIIDKDRFSTSLDNLKVVMSVLVITIHLSLPCRDAAYLSLQSFIKSVVCGVAVPAFFCISGYLFFRNFDGWNWRKFGNKVRRRVSTLLLPYLLWNSVSFALVTIARLRHEGIFDAVELIGGGMRIFWNSNQYPSETIGILGQMLPEVYPLLEPLWYLRDLMIMVVLSPVFYYLITKYSKFFIVVLVIGYIFTTANIYPIISGSAWMFYGLGAYLSICRKQLYTGKMITLVVTSILAISLAICLGYMDMSSVLRVHVLAVYKIIAVLAVLEVGFHTSVFFRMPKILAKSTMFAYCFHPFILSIIVYPIINALSIWHNAITSSMTFFVAPIVIMCLCALIYTAYKFTTMNCKFLLNGR